MKGFTLVELMVSLGVLVVGLLGILLANTYTEKASQGAYERMVTLQDAHRAIELMRSASATGDFPTNVTSAFPNEARVTGFNNLSGEQVIVTYPDSKADPLDLTVTTSWKERGVRNFSIRLRTLMTKRN